MAEIDKALPNEPRGEVTIPGQEELQEKLEQPEQEQKQHLL